MGVKKTTEAIATKKAIEVANLYVAKFNNLLNSAQQSNLGTVTEIMGPNKFKVKSNGVEKIVTYTGFRPIDSNGVVVLNGDFAT